MEAIIRESIANTEGADAPTKEAATTAALDKLAAYCAAASANEGRIGPADAVKVVTDAIVDWAALPRNSGVPGLEVTEAKEASALLLAPDSAIWDDGVMDEQELLEVMTKAVTQLTSVDAAEHQKCIDHVKFACQCASTTAVYL